MIRRKIKNIVRDNWYARFNVRDFKPWTDSGYNKWKKSW